MKRDPHRLTYRVRRIPSTWTLDKLKAALLEGLDIADDKQVRVRVLATDLSRFNREICRTAIVSFGLEDRSFSTRFSLKTFGVKLECDTVFDDLTPLSSCDGNEQHRIDCIVIPGWGGHPIGSFMAEDSPYLWILDGLGSDFPALRVWTYGYGSSLVQQGPGEHVSEFADSFVRSLRRLRLGLGASQKQRPIIYIAHSLGGLVFKEAIIQMQKSKDQLLKESLVATYGALLFAVPSAGMDVEAIASMVGDLPARTTLHDLDFRIGQRLRLKQHLEFCDAFQFEDSILARFYELYESRTVVKDSSGKWSRTGKPRQLVTLPSASLGRSWEVDVEFIIGLEGDHSTLVKLPDYFKEKRDERISDVLEKFLAVATEVVASRFRLLSDSANSGTSERHFLTSQLAKRSYDAFCFGREKELTQKEQEKRLREECLKTLSFGDMGSRYNRVEQSLPGTCLWIFQNPKYLDWLAAGLYATRRSFLWIKGKAGSGKSTLMKTIVQQICALPSRPIVISFFFDARGNLLERSPLGLFRTLVKELVSEQPQLLDKLLPLFRRMKDTLQLEWRMPDLHQWFKQIIEDEELGPVYVLIDALDECDEDNIDQRTSRDHGTNARTLVRFFESLMTSPTEQRNPLLLCLSSRHYPHITVRNDIKIFEVFMEGENDQDIRKFIESALTSSSLDTDLMQETLSDMIAHRSRGVFLWVVLVIQALLRAQDQGRPRNQWRTVLEGLPTTLNEMFRQIMSNLKDEDRLDSSILFQILLLGKESMNFESVRHAFSFAVDESLASLEMWKLSDIYLPEEAFRKRIRDLSCGLIEVKDDHNSSFELETRVQFVHETVRTFFGGSDYATLAEIHPEIGPSRDAKTYGMVMRACFNYVATKDALESCLKYGALLLREESDPYKRMPFLKYAGRWIYDYIESAETLSSETRQMSLYRLFKGPSNELFKTWKGAYYSVHGFMRLRPESLADYYMRSAADFFDYAAQMALSYCVSAGLRDGRGAGYRTSRGITPLMRMLIYQCENGARMLLTQGVDVRARDDYGRSVLYYARSTEMIEMLLDAGAEVNGIWRPMVHLIGALDRNENPGEGLNALMDHIGNTGIVECLLRNGADVNERSMWGETALHFVSSEDVAKLILPKQPDREVKDCYGFTAADRARRAGHNGVACLIDGHEPQDKDEDEEEDEREVEEEDEEEDEREDEEEDEEEDE